MPFTAFSFRQNRKLAKTCPPVRKALLIMKLIAVFLFVASMQVFAEAHSQTVTLSVKNAPFQKVLKEIRKQTGYNYICTVEMMELVGNVTVEAKNVSLQEALQAALQKTPLTYTIVENTIVIKRKVTAEPTATVTKESPPADITVKGKVTDESGAPLQGASVTVKGTAKGVNTDAQGDFSITVPDNSSMILVISYVGMEVKEVNVKGLTSVQVTLNKQEIQQQEIVVVGYGTQKKATVTGAIAQVGTKVLQSAPVPNTSQLLVGRMPGLLAKTASGLPGEDNASLQIRG